MENKKTEQEASYDQEVIARFARMKENWEAQEKLKANFVASLPQSQPCERHPGEIQLVNADKSWCQKVPVFSACPVCIAEYRQQQDEDRLRGFGVPLNLLKARLDNWTPVDEIAKANLTKVQEFEKARRGFLVMLGDLGTGKSHLAVGVLRKSKSGLYVKQSELLRRLRQSYRDKAADDPVDEAQDAGCLVLDEVGFSAGGRDELPMLHDILDHRHGNQMPTILSGNITMDELDRVIGERMADRLRESNFAVLTFGGSSHRASARDRYFEQIIPAGAVNP